MRLLNINCGSGPATASFTGAAVDSNQLINMTFQMQTTDATAAGAFKIQASNDMPGQAYDGVFVPTNWSDIPSATSTMAAGVAPLIVIPNLACRWIRVVFTRTGGAAVTINVVMCAQGI